MFDKAAIAERLRALLGGPDRDDVGQTAKRLGIEEASLRMNLDDASPHPTVEVLVAVIRKYGVDPHWLLTGTYDSASHRLAMEGDDVASSVRELMGTPRPRISEPTFESFTINDRS